MGKMWQRIKFTSLNNPHTQSHTYVPTIKMTIWLFECEREYSQSALFGKQADTHTHMEWDLYLYWNRHSNQVTYFHRVQRTFFSSSWIGIDCAVLKRAHNASIDMEYMLPWFSRILIDFHDHYLKLEPTKKKTIP